MQRKHIISLCILLCVLAVLVAFRPSADETVPLTGSASAGLILLDGQSGGYYVLAVIDQSRADRAGIEAGDTLLTLNGKTLNLGKLNERQLELLERAKTKGWGQ